MITPLFALVLAVVVGIMLIAMGVNVYLVASGASSDMAKDLAATCADTWKSGAAAFFGLIAGKSI